MTTQRAAVRIRIEDVTKRFGPVAAVDDVSLVVEPGTFVVLLGPSGSGKTTMLRMIAGLEEPTAGRIWLGDVDATRIPAHRRGIGYVFQRPSMFPHYTVAENIAWGLKLRHMPADQIRDRVAETIRLVRLEGLEQRYATQLSGGQAQRVCIARALAPDPAILLLDEPLSALDARLRDELKDAIAEIHGRTGKTTVMVTHDQREALSLADTVAVMDGGRIAQLGSPTEVYRRPRTPFVAGFVGSTNLVDATVLERSPQGGVRIRLMDQEVDVPDADSHAPGDQVVVGIRPDDVRLVDAHERDRHGYVFEARVRRVSFVGEVVQIEAEVDAGTLRLHATGPDRFALLERHPETVLFAPGSLIVMPAAGDGGR